LLPSFDGILNKASILVNAFYLKPSVDEFVKTGSGCRRLKKKELVVEDLYFSIKGLIMLPLKIDPRRDG
jgi:hypothetical protein